MLLAGGLTRIFTYIHTYLGASDRLLSAERRVAPVGRGVVLEMGLIQIPGRGGALEGCVSGGCVGGPVRIR